MIPRDVSGPTAGRGVADCRPMGGGAASRVRTRRKINTAYPGIIGTVFLGRHRLGDLLPQIGLS